MSLITPTDLSTTMSNFWSEILGNTSSDEGQWITETNKYESQSTLDAKTRESFKALSNGLRQLKTISIAASLKEYLGEILLADSIFQASADIATAKISNLYGVRSSVIHRGKNVSYDDLSTLDTMVRKLLIAIMRTGPTKLTKRKDAG